MTPPTVHHDHEQHAWTIEIPDHPPRSDSPLYRKSRAKLHELVQKADGLIGAQTGPIQDHHGGGLWLKDADGWFMVKNIAGIEWSAQFCADPAKVDALRRNARRLYEAYPDAVTELDIRQLLDTPIVDAAGVATWTDSICNASVPLPGPEHVGVVPPAHEGGVHHYPTPITDIDLFKRDDFTLWVEVDGSVAAVVPMAAGPGVQDTRVLFAASRPPTGELTPFEQIVGPQFGAANADDDHEWEKEGPVLSSTHPVSKAAFNV
jgi:Family of unknown function (DUF6424)